jgi:NADH:ubiquinone oxidoreductase subunit 3 (subunit A)
MFTLLFYEEYSSIFILGIFAFFVSVILFSASFFLSVQNPDTEKLSAYECGFDPYEDARNAFDVRFYIVGILFLIFDIEAMFLFPWVVSINSLGSFGFWVMVDFLIELTIGFVYAWKIGALEWE